MSVPIFLQTIPNIDNIIQHQLIERAFRDSLVPMQLFVGSVASEEWGGNVGDSRLFTRAGTLKPKTRPLNPRQDPTPSVVSYEQWEAAVEQRGDSIVSDMLTNIVAAASTLDRDTHQLGIGAGMSQNRVARDKLYAAYLSGHSFYTEAAPVVIANNATGTVHVKNLNGFTRTAILKGRPQLVSATNPIPVTINGVAADAFQVTGFTPDVADDELGAGDLSLKNVSGGSITINQFDNVIADNAPAILRAGSGLLNPLGLTGADLPTFDLFASAVALLRSQNVPTFPDGLYHAHIDPIQEAALLRDPTFRQLNTSLPDYPMYGKLAVGKIAGILFIRNSECPTEQTLEDDESIGNDVLLSDTGAVVRRAIVMGYGAIHEHWVDELKRIVSEAGITGKVGAFSIMNNGIAVMTDHIRYTIRAPLDALQQLVTLSWSSTTDYSIPTDFLTGSPATLKRAVVIETA